jgi:UDP-N-acetylmuramoyl-L-alanyl-D-glutamate--2,6-diaminopimelate ligase
MNLAELLDGMATLPLEPQYQDIQIKGITLDSREVTKGFVFFALSGSVEHGLKYAQQVIDSGANAIIYEPSGSEAYELDDGIPHLAIKGLGIKLAQLAKRFYQKPSKKVDVIGITGTNGKTTCSQFLLQLLPHCGVIGTLGWGDKERLYKTQNTTPDVLTVQRLLAAFANNNKETIVMEVSSHGLQQGRVDAVDFKAAVFTNLSRDHLDYHGSMDDYLQAKLLLFKNSGLKYVVVNTDDKYSQQFLDTVKKKVKCWAFSRSGKNLVLAENVTAENIEYRLSGIKCVVCWGAKKASLQTSIMGNFNLENILAVITVLLAQGYELNDAVSKANTLQPINGRMESFGGRGKPYIVVDFAHTPDALKKVLQSVKKFCQKKLIVVFGCGGGRDKGKRVVMGTIAENYADQIILTSDNPRLESAEQIIKDIKKGCSGDAIEVIQDRKLAIQTAIKNAQQHDCIVIAGKGHEDYQEIKGIKHPFSDQKVVMKALQDKD